jgi:hypothetical protein
MMTATEKMGESTYTVDGIIRKPFDRDALKLVSNGSFSGVLVS